MNAPDILHYGDLHLRDALSGLTDTQGTVVGVTRRWATKDVLAHLAAYETALAELLEQQLRPDQAAPTLEEMRLNHERFVEKSVSHREARSLSENIAEYSAAHTRIMQAIENISADRLRARGTIPWYGEQYSLEDFIVYANYGHKEEHTAQIKMFRRIQGY